jgi:hypothetical protein
MQECNPPRNSWLQTHQDDETRGGAGDGPVPVLTSEHRIDRFAHASENSFTIGCACRDYLMR